MGGGGGKKPKSPGASPYETEMAKITRDFYGATDPLRDATLAQLGAAMSGGYSPKADAMYAPMFSSQKAGIEAQYGNARDNILAGTARGGAQTTALGNLEMQRAQDMGTLPAQLSAQILEGIINQARSTALGSTGQAQSAFGNLAQTWGQRQGNYQNYYSQRKGQNIGAATELGKGVATLFGG